MGSFVRAAFALGVATVLWVNAPTIAHALEYQVRRSERGAVLKLDGQITLRDVDRLRSVLDRVRSDGIQYVSLNSPGGNLTAGIDLGRIIRQKNLATLVEGGAICASACAFILAGGVVREVQPGAKVGVHMASLMFGDTYVSKIKAILSSQEGSLDTRIRLIVSLNEQTAARAMSLQATYLQEMGVSLQLLYEIAETHHLEVELLSLARLRQYNLSNVD